MFKIQLVEPSIISKDLIQNDLCSRGSARSPSPTNPDQVILESLKKRIIHMMRKLQRNEKPRLVFRLCFNWLSDQGLILTFFKNQAKHQTLSFKVEGNVLQYADDVVIYDRLKISKPMRPGLYTVHAFIKPKAGSRSTLSLKSTEIFKSNENPVQEHGNT